MFKISDISKIDLLPLAKAMTSFLSFSFLDNELYLEIVGYKFRFERFGSQKIFVFGNKDNSQISTNFFKTANDCSNDLSDIISRSSLLV